jgi:hypothetical protein
MAVDASWTRLPIRWPYPSDESRHGRGPGGV